MVLTEKNARSMDMDDILSAVFEIVRRVPPGRATSYGAIARAVGLPRHARLIGRIMSNCGDFCVDGDDIPAHRVVDSAGRLSAAAAFPRMQERLESEGVTVRNRRIAGWRHIRWNPLEEL